MLTDAQLFPPHPSRTHSSSTMFTEPLTAANYLDHDHHPAYDHHPPAAREEIEDEIKTWLTENLREYHSVLRTVSLLTGANRGGLGRVNRDPSVL